MNKQQPAVIVTDVDYNNLCEMNARLEKSANDRLARAESAEAEAAALREQLATAQAEVKRLTSYLEAMHSDDYHDMALLRLEQKIDAYRFEHTAPIEQRDWASETLLDWRADDETPLGQALDDLGDEVE